MGEAGVEPARLAAQDPKSCVAASYTTRPTNDSTLRDSPAPSILRLDQLGYRQQQCRTVRQRCEQSAVANRDGRRRRGDDRRMAVARTHFLAGFRIERDEEPGRVG